MSEKDVSAILQRVEKMLSDAADDDAFARNHGDGANLTGLPPRDIYELGRSTLLLNWMGRFTAIKSDYLADVLSDQCPSVLPDARFPVRCTLKAGHTGTMHGGGGCE